MKEKNHTSREEVIPLTTIDSATLMDQPLRQMPFVVDGFLSNGLHLLAGSPKIGKSWLALWISLCVAEGEPLWGMPTRQGTTLYLSLEDTLPRIQNRLFSITEDGSPNAMYAIEALPLGKGLEQQLQDFIHQHPDTALVIIDTIQMVRPATRENTYANDYRDLSALKAIADENEIAILLIHHLRKEDDRDTFNRISGTTGMQGAVDSSFTLVESSRGSGRAKLSCIGRDIGYGELELQRNSENVWELVQDSREPVTSHANGMVELILGFMRERDFFEGRPSELADALSAISAERVTSRGIGRQLKTIQAELAAEGIRYQERRSNGKRLVSLLRQQGGMSADSADLTALPHPPPGNDPFDTARLRPS